METYRNSIRSIGVAFLSPGSVSSGGGDDIASTVDEDGDDNLMSGIRSFLSKLGVESDRLNFLDQESEFDSQISEVFDDRRGEDSSLLFGNKENERRNSLTSPGASFSRLDDNKDLSDRTFPQTESGFHRVPTPLGSTRASERTTLQTENGLHRIPTPLGSTRATQSRNPTPRSAVLTPRSTNFGFTTPRAIPTFGPIRSNSTITPISENKVLNENGFQAREQDNLLPAHTFSFEEAVKNERNRPCDGSSEENSPVTTHVHETEPEPVISPRGDAGPLYLVPSIDSEASSNGATTQEPEPVVSPRGDLGPLYLLSTDVINTESKLEDPFEWAYEVWRARGLMPAKVKPALTITSISNSFGANVASSLLECDSRDLSVVERSPISEGSRHRRFANVRLKWEEKSKDKVGSPFFAAQCERSPPTQDPLEPQLSKPVSQAIIVAPSPSEAFSLAQSSDVLPVALPPSHQTQLSVYVSKYSPPRPSSTNSRRKVRSSIDKSEAMYNDGSEPFVRQASARALKKKNRSHRLLQQDVESKDDLPCLEIAVASQEKDALDPHLKDGFGQSNEHPKVIPHLGWSAHERSVVVPSQNYGTEAANDETLAIEDQEIMSVFQRPFCTGHCEVVAEENPITTNGNFMERGGVGGNCPSSVELVPYQATGAPTKNHVERCLCGNAFVGGSDNLVNFFLPRLDIGCTCGQNLVEFDNPDEPTALENILRPWQCEFLRSYGIWKGDQLVKAHHRSAGFLAKGLKYWRVHQQRLPGVRTRSCVVALNIWSRSCKAFVRAVRFQLSEGKTPLERPSILGSLSQFLQQMDVEAIYQAEATPQTERTGLHQRRKSIESTDQGSGLRQSSLLSANEHECAVEL